MESVKTNEQELTSTMGSLLSTTKEEKNDTSDSTPTSSTDAFTTTSTSQIGIAADDPISSTSSDILDSKKPDKHNDVLQSVSCNIVNPTTAMSSLKNIVIDHTSSIVSEKDLLDMNITDTSTEKITENVDDIVQDLENLLGEPTTTIDFTLRSKESQLKPTISHSKDISMDLDEFSVEFQMPEEQPKEVKHDNASYTISEIDNYPNNRKDGNEVLQNIKDDVLKATDEDSKQESGETINSELNKEKIETTLSKCIDSRTNDFSESKLEHAEGFKAYQASPGCVASTKNDEKHHGENQDTEKPIHLDISSTSLQETEISQQAETSDSGNYAQGEEASLTVTERTIESSEKPDNEISFEFNHLQADADSESCDKDFQNQTEKTSGLFIFKHEKVDEKNVVMETQVQNNGETMETTVQNISENTQSEKANVQTLEESVSKQITIEDVSTMNKENEQKMLEKSIDINSSEDVEHQRAPDDTIRDIPSTCTHDGSNSEIFMEINEMKEKQIFADTGCEHMQLGIKEEKQEHGKISNVEEFKENIVDQNKELSVISSVYYDKNAYTQEGKENVTKPEPEIISVHEDLTENSGKESIKTVSIIETLNENTTECKIKSVSVMGIDKHESRHCIDDELSTCESKLVYKLPIEKQTIFAEVSENDGSCTDIQDTYSQLAENIIKNLNEHNTNEECLEIAVMQQSEDLENSLSSNTQIPLQNDNVEMNVNYSDAEDTKIVDNVPSIENQEDLNINVFEDSIVTPIDVHGGEGGVLIEKPSVDTEPASNNTLSVRQDVLEENIATSSESIVERYDAGDNVLTSPLHGLDTSSNLQDERNEEIPSSSMDNSKNIEDGVLDNNILPLVMEDVADIDMLNAISTLSDNKSDVMPEISDNVENNDTLLGSNTLVHEDQHSVENIPFEPCMDSALPTVDEIFAEQNDHHSVDLPDDNLETLLAVASLQSVCETGNSYNMSSVEDITPFTSDEQNIKIQDEKLDSLFDQKEETPISLEAEQTEIEQVTETASLTENVELTKNQVEESEPTELFLQNQEDKLKEPLVINVDSTEKEKVYSPKITIKPIKLPVDEEVTNAAGETDGNKGSLKMTITKQSDTMHSILKIYDPSDETSQRHENDESQSEPLVPKLIIKPIVQPSEHPHSPKMSTRSSKQVFSPSSSGTQRSASPRITIKPIVKPENIPESVSPLKITIKPVLKPEENYKQKHSPKLTIKPIVKPEEENTSESKIHSPRVTIKPVVKPSEEQDQAPNPRITIKPIVKPEAVIEQISNTPRVTIKPVVKPQEKDKNAEFNEQPVERSSPKITIKPIIKPQEPEDLIEDFEESAKERIVLKINKGTLPGSSKEQRKRDLSLEDEKSEKTPRIKLKFSKEGGHPHIVQDASPTKRSFEQSEHDKFKRQKLETEHIMSGVTITPVGPSHSKLKEMLSKSSSTGDKVIIEDDDEVTIVEDQIPNKPSPIIISEESNQDSINVPMDVRDPISEIPVFEITPESVKTINPQSTPLVIETAPTLPTPRKRGRPRKVPLQVREDFKDPKEEEPKPIVVESTRPKRSCRGQSVRTTLGIKPRKPRGPGRGRGSKRGMGTRSTPTPTPPSETPPKPAKEPKLTAAKLKPVKEDLLLLSDKTEVKQIETDDGFHKSSSQPVLAPPQTEISTTDRADIVMYEEETRMSAETCSRAQTPAKQVVSSVPSADLVEESQSSVQSTATTESVKVRKGPRLEVHQEPEGAVISADQLAEYYWSGGGPYMLQEQVAQFLGIKSFKRKYPNIQRRVVDMQERDFIRESGLAGEAMCDLGLTAVNSSDILDIMYSDFQDKYEEYCKHQRDRQAKDLTNKQKALSLAASQEKTKMDITQQAVQSAATWNAGFNKARRDERKACMDLQTLTVHFPKGKIKQINKTKVGSYPVALVPGQFTDYYREFTPTEINNLPLNTMCYDPIIKGTVQEMDCDSQTDGSGSESESTTSDSDSSYSGSSDPEDCTLCHKAPLKRIAAVQ